MARGLDAWFALAPDGEHLATSARTAVGDPDRVRFVTNFFQELKAKAPLN
jgi:hypothetical protein